MSDDFDDDLYNAYNRAEKEDDFDENELYGREAAEYKEDEEEHDSPPPSSSSPQQQQMNTGDNQNMWGYRPNPYQQYLAAYQMSLQQQMMHPYQMQMMRQYTMQQYKPKPTKETDKPIVASAANTDEGKMFIGGLNWDTSDESLRDYFSQFGPVVECIVMRDPLTQRSRGFGFLTMKENADVDKIVSQEHHYLDGKRIDPKRAIPREEQDKTEKIFVGGISPEVNEEEFRTFFSQFGTVLDATLMLERDTGRPRGFGFITFEDSQGVEEALKNPHLSIKDKTIEVKRAMPKGKQNRHANFRPNQRYQSAMRYNMYPPQMAAPYYPSGFDQRRNNRNEGGPVHPSSSRQSHYRPYNNAEAGPSQKRLNSITNKQPKLELAEKVEIFPSTRLQDCLDYSILVSNNTSMARDQLANERNWLTWFRLSCTLIILGFTLLLQFRLPDSTDQDGNLTVSKANDFASKPIGFIFIGIGLSCFFVGVGKYFKSQRLLVKQATFVEAGWGSLVMVGILFCFVCSVMIMASINTSRNSFLNNP